MEECKTRNVKALQLVRNCPKLSRKTSFAFLDQLQAVLVTLNGLSDRAIMIEVNAGSLLSEFIDTLELFQSKVLLLSKQKKIEKFLSGNKLKRKINALLVSLRQLVTSIEQIAQHFQRQTIELPGEQQPASISTIYAPINSLATMEARKVLQQAEQVSCFSPEAIRATVHNQKLDIVWNHLFGEDSFAVGWEDFLQALKDEGVSVNQSEDLLLRNILDNSSTGCVTRNKLCEFLKSFGPLSDCVRNVGKIAGCAWFHGYMTAEESHHYLEPETLGTFLVRFSNSKPGAFALDYVSLSEFNAQSQPLYGPIRSNSQFSAADMMNYGSFSSQAQQKVVLSVLIESVGIGFRLKENVTNSDRVFKSIHDVLQHYESVLVRPFTSTLANEPWFHGTINSEEAEDMLQDQPSGTFLIRFSSQPGCFAASFVDMHGNTCKSLITRVHGGFTFEQSERTIYRTIQELVEEFRKNRVFLYPQMTTLRSRVHSSRSSAISLSSFSQILSIPSDTTPRSTTSSPTPLEDWNASAANQRILERRSTGGLRSERAHSYHVATAHRRLDVQLWDVNEVQDWLETIQLEMLKDTFRDNEINGVALLDLNELDMRNDLKMVLGHRKKLLKAVQEFV